MKENNTQFMRAWARCYRTKYVGVTLSQWVDHFDKYRKWFHFRSVTMPGRKIHWNDR